MAIRKEKRKNDFRYVLDYYDQFGKRHYQALPKGATRKEADAAEREILALIAKGVYIPSNGDVADRLEKAVFSAHG